MKFEETSIPGAFVIDLEPIRDDRGFFARSWCATQFAKHGLSTTITQVNTALSVAAGTLRGMHFQAAPHAEVKVVQVPRGSAYDVVLDLRPDSPQYRRWFGLELSEQNFRALYIPEGCAHGYITLEPDTVLTYSTSVDYAPKSAAGVRFDDPAFGIHWPRAASVVSSADRAWPAFAG
ncbi:MAG: dTDP-4-dehydrorhamnose 3,5-epimerase family protein [Gammaproteobacteria bacterium]